MRYRKLWNTCFQHHMQALLKALAMAGACRALSGVAHGLQQPIFSLMSHVRLMRLLSILYGVPVHMSVCRHKCIGGT